MSETTAPGQTQGSGYGLLLVTITCLSWGTIGIVVSIVYGMVPAANPLGVGFLRLAIAAPALAFFSRWLVGPQFWRIRRQHIGPLVLVGVSFAVYQVCYFAAIPYLGVAAAVMINICSVPIFTALLANRFLGERFDQPIVIALIGGVIGTALLVGGAPQAGEPLMLLAGTLLALGAGFGYSLVVLGSRTLAPHYHPLQPITLAFGLGAVLLLPAALVTGFTLDYGSTGWLLLLYLGLVPTAAGYVLYYRGLQTVTATVTAIITLLEPLGSTILALTFLNEQMSLVAGIGIVLLLASLAQLYWRRGTARG
jgi:DME family drug/metabolite transporter